MHFIFKRVLFFKGLDLRVCVFGSECVGSFKSLVECETDKKVFMKCSNGESRYSEIILKVFYFLARADIVSPFQGIWLGKVTNSSLKENILAFITCLCFLLTWDAVNSLAVHNISYIYNACKIMLKEKFMVTVHGMKGLNITVNVYDLYLVDCE